jgi:hypothetical protein
MTQKSEAGTHLLKETQRVDFNAYFVARFRFKTGKTFKNHNMSPIWTIHYGRLKTRLQNCRYPFRNLRLRIPGTTEVAQGDVPHTGKMPRRFLAL